MIFIFKITKGQLLPAVLLLENLNLLQFLTSGVQLRGSDEQMQEFKALAVVHRHVIKNYLNVTISDKLTPVAIAQKLLAKIDLKLDYVGRLGKRENRDCVYQFVAPDDERDSIFGQWLNRDELFQSESVNVLFRKQKYYSPSKGKTYLRTTLWLRRRIWSGNKNLGHEFVLWWQYDPRQTVRVFRGYRHLRRKNQSLSPFRGEVWRGVLTISRT